METVTFDEFSDVYAGPKASPIRFAVAGVGPPVLLLHGFPQTHVMWRKVAPYLAEHFTVFCADLPGQGQSALAAADEVNPYSKRGMANKLLSALSDLGHASFAVVDHDRGGRVAYRMALDHPEAVTKLVVCDIVPIADALERADERMLLSFWPWSVMAQPAPLPEKLVSSAPEAVIEDSITQWGTCPEAFSAEIRGEYANALRSLERVHAICEEFRAAATVDRAHDEEDRTAGHQIHAPTLVLWDQKGALSHWYADAGGPLAIWRQWGTNVRGLAVPGGHFFPESEPGATVACLLRFLRRT